MAKKQQRKRVRDDQNLLGHDAATEAAMQLMMYDPGAQHLDLSKAEKIRTTALLMAINYVRETICQDAEMYRALRQDSKELVPATIPWVLKCSVEFEDFLLGNYSQTNVGLVKRGAEMEEKREEAARVTQSAESASGQASESPQSVDAVDPQGDSNTGTPSTRV